jgi:hypothetical protein
MSAPQMRSPAPPASGNRADKSSFARRRNSTQRAASAIDFAAINCAALARINAVLMRLLPGGRAVAGEWQALNPRRADTHLGSFKVRMVGARAGVWSDFATRDHGGDLISLVAYLEAVNQGEAARRLAMMLGLECGGRRHG